ncbi:hypothetical protein K1719_021361 [Acacia pycnantha]|nr:hypothetical protein K1719_021361 [Acacia pycnantha]
MSQRFSSRVKKKDPNCDLEPRQSNSDSRKESEEQGDIGHQREPKPKRKRQMMVMVAVGCKLWSLQSKWLRGSIQLWYGRPSRN